MRRNWGRVTVVIRDDGDGDGDGRMVSSASLITRLAIVSLGEILEAVALRAKKARVFS
jgi:hypothetical protein